MLKGVDMLDPEDKVLSNPAYTLPRFNTLHLLAQQQVNSGDKESAQDTYNRMLVLYDEINRSNLPPDDKQKAYGKLMYVFTAVSNKNYIDTAPGLVSMGKYLFPISFVVIVLLIIFFVKPEFSLTGLAVADADMAAPYWNGGSPAFKVRGATEIDLGAYFEGEGISYSAGYAPNVDIRIYGSKMVITPDPMVKGLRVAAITAANSAGSARVVATLDIQ